jgi:hypothetical protein
MPDITDIERLNYYEGEFLGAVDFEAEQEYHRDMRRRHNLGPHTWGIVTGLDVAQFPNGGPNNEVDVYIQPGVAVDGFGREIIVLSPTQLTAEMFADFPSKQTLTVWIGYTQQLINPDSDTCAASSQTNAYSRVQENFQIVVDPIQPTSDPVIVGGNNVTPPSTTGWKQPSTLPQLPTVEGSVIIALDDSVPFQALPDDNTTANWLVPLGQVLWDGVNEVFLSSAPATANKGRIYAGSVAATLYAPAGSLVIKDRSTPSPWDSSYTGAAVEVQGALTVDALLTAQSDVWINGGDVYFNESGGSDGDTELYMTRITNASAGADLHIHIGDGSNPKKTPQRLTVGYGTSTAAKDTNALIVSADGSVTIPSGPLSFGNQTGPLLNLSGTGYYIGVEASTLYFQSASNFAWCVNGDYNATQGSTPSATLTMFIDSDGDLTIDGAMVIDNANGNTGQISPGLTFGHNSGEGVASKRTSGGNQYGLDFYTNSEVRMCITNGGSVGIGTGSPATTLDVYGGISVENNTFYLRAPGDTYHHIRYGMVGGLSDSDGHIFNSNFVVAHGPDGSETARLVVQGNGNVGIGTTSPSEALQVVGAGLFGSDGKSISGSQNYGVVYLGDPNHYIRSVYGGGLRLGTFGAPDAILVQQSTGNVTVTGDLTINGKLHGTNKSGYVTDRFYSRGKKPFERGDVVALYSKPNAVYYGNQNRIPIVEVTLACKAADTRVCGVVDEPVLSADETADLDRKALGSGNIGDMVTLGAYACCKVTAEAFAIEPGDLLTTSEKAGYAQRLDPMAEYPVGCVIGKALAGLDKGTGVIPILVSYQ